MELKINVTKRLSEKYPDSRFVAVVAKGLKNSKHNEALEKEKDRIIEDIRLKIKDPSAQALVKGYNEFFSKFGKKVPIEYQLQSIKEGKHIPTDFSVKDVLFIAEMKHHVVMSGQDLDKIRGDLLFDLSDGGENFIKITKKSEKLKADDIVLRQGGEILISHVLGPGYSTVTDESTKDCLYLFWFVPKTSMEARDEIVDDFIRQLGMLSDKNTLISKIDVDGASDSSFVVTPWDVKGNIDYDKLIKDFGTEKIDDKLLERLRKHTGELHPFLRRNIYFSHRDLGWILDKLDKGEKFHLYTGRGPSGKVHLGHLVPWMMTKWLQDKFDTELWFQLTDDEKFLVKDKELEDLNRIAYDNALDVIAMGFKPGKTHIFADTDYIHAQYKIALKVAKKTTFSTAKGIFGFNESSNIGIIFFPALQTVPCFLPSELRGKNMPILIPASIDQDPYWRMARDVAEKLGYYKPAQIHGRFLPGLQGMVSDGKMSSSAESTAIFTTDDPKTVKNKILRYAFSGGQDTVEAHRKLGGNPDIDVAYQWLTFFEEDDEKLKKVYDDYKSGKLLSGELKMMLADKINTYLAGHQKRREEAKKNLEKFMMKD